MSFYFYNIPCCPPLFFWLILMVATHSTGLLPSKSHCWFPHLALLLTAENRELLKILRNCIWWSKSFPKVVISVLALCRKAVVGTPGSLWCTCRGSSSDLWFHFPHMITPGLKLCNESESKNPSPHTVVILHVYLQKELHVFSCCS